MWCWVRALCAMVWAVAPQLCRAVPCQASSPGAAAASGQSCDGEGEREPNLLVPACTRWQVLATPKLVDCSWGLQSALLPSAQCEVRHQITVGSGNLCESGRTWGIHPGLAEWQKMCFLATLKVSWFAYKRGKDSDVKLLERKGKLSERPDAPFKRWSP